MPKNAGLYKKNPVLCKKRLAVSVDQCNNYPTEAITRQATKGKNMKMKQSNGQLINTKSSGMVIDSFDFSLIKKVEIFNKLNSSRFREVTELEFLAIQECFYALEQGLVSSSMGKSVYAGCCDASRPWRAASLGAVLFGQGQSWEVDDEAYVMESNGKYYITYIGEIAFSQYEKRVSDELAKAQANLIF